MNDDYLTLRLSRELARLLARWARDRGVPKSHLVREAVTNYLTPATAGPEPPRAVTAAELAARWPRLARLSPEEAHDLGADLAAARRKLPPVPARWG